MQERSRGVTAKDVGRLLSAFARTARARGLYQGNSAALERMRNDLERSFQEILDDIQVLSLRVRPGAFVYDDQIVLQDEDLENSVPFALYRDGIRRLDFSRGLSGVELDTFLSSIARGFTYSGLGDDIVSDLWKQELENIRYLVVDTAIVDAAQAAQAPAAEGEREILSDLDTQIDGLLRAIYGDSADDVGPRSINLDGSDLAAKAIAETLDAIDEMAPGFHPPRTFIDRPACAARFDHEIAQETPNRVGARAANASLKALHADLTAADKDVLADALLKVFDAAVVSRDVPLATRVVAGVRSIVDGGPRIERWLAEAISDARLRHVASGFLESGGEAAFAELHRLFKACGPRAVPSMLGILPSFADARLRRSLTDLVLELGLGSLQPVEELLKNEQLFVVQEALYILNNVDTPEARLIEKHAEDSPRAEVRVAAVMAALERSPAHALPRAERLLYDPDPRSTVVAAQILAKIGGPEATAIIERYVERPELDALPNDVRRELFRAYARLCQVRSLHLLARYVKRGEGMLAKKETEDLAIAAMDGVMIVRVPRAVDILKKAAATRNKRVREAARARLGMMKGKR